MTNTNKMKYFADKVADAIKKDKELIDRFKVLKSAKLTGKRKIINHLAEEVGKDKEKIIYDSSNKLVKSLLNEQGIFISGSSEEIDSSTPMQLICGRSSSYILYNKFFYVPCPEISEKPIAIETKIAWRNDQRLRLIDIEKIDSPINRHRRFTYYMLEDISKGDLIREDYFYREEGYVYILNRKTKEILFHTGGYIENLLSSLEDYKKLDWFSLEDSRISETIRKQVNREIIENGK